MNDKGFFAMVPRIVRTGYKHLSHACKWLYACLTDLCGKNGECFRSLRSLAQETDISTGSLSKMIPQLAAAGLIQATKGDKNIYHIRVVSIWKQNVQFCSGNEQKESSTVQILNTNVQNLGTSAPDSSQNLNTTVQNLDTKKMTSKKILNPKDMNEEEIPSPVSSLLNWFEEKGIKTFKSTVGGHLQELAGEIKTREQFDSLCVVAKEKLDKIPGNDGELNSGNLVSALPLWKATHNEVISAPQTAVYTDSERPQNATLHDDNTASRAPVKHGMIRCYADRLADRIRQDLPGVLVEVQAWNKHLWTVHVNDMEFTSNAEYDEWQSLRKTA